MLNLNVIFLLILFTNVTHQSCDYSIIWREELCISSNQIELNNSIFPPNNPRCNIQQMSVLKLLQNDPPNINLLYNVRTEEEMLNCNLTDPVESTSLSAITQFTLSRGLYSFDQSYYFISPLNSNTCLQLAFHVISNRPVKTCELDQMCTHVRSCNAQTVSTTCNVTSYPMTKRISSTTKNNTICTTTNNQCKPPSLPNSSNKFIFIALLTLGIVILVSIVITSVCIVISSFYLYNIFRKRRFMENIHLEEEDFNFTPKELTSYLRSITIKKEINKDDIRVIIRENISQIVQDNSLHQNTPY